MTYTPYKRRLKPVLVVLIALVFVVMFMFPYIYLGFSTVKTNQDVISTEPTIIPKVFSVENWVRLFERLPVMKYMGNSLIITLGATLMAIFLGGLAAYALERSGSKLSSFLIVIVLCLKMIPLSSIAVPVFSIVMDLGIYDTKIAMILVLAAVNMPYVMWMMCGYYRNIPRSLDQAAIIDGASAFKTFTKVILPVSAPGIVTAALFVMFGCWNDFIFGLLLTSINAKTFSVAISEFISAFALDMGPMTSAAFLFSFPVLIVSIFLQKYIIQGYTSGAVKE